MAIYQIQSDSLSAVPQTTFAAAGIKERADLQRFLRERIEVVAPDVLVISEEFNDWEDSQRRIDLLAIDQDANLVVIELKRTDDGSHMELQAIRYAAMVSTMTFDKAATAFDRYLRANGSEDDARTTMLDFLGWDEPNESAFANDVRIILVSAEFSKEITTAVMWLNERALDIRCVRLKPYLLDGQVIIDAQQVIPLPEAASYQIQVREKQQTRRSASSSFRTEEEIWAMFEEQCDSDEVKLVRDLCQWVDPLVTQVFSTRDGFAQSLTIGSTHYYFFKLRPDGRVVMWLQYLAKKPPFTDENVRLEFIEQLNRLSGVEINLEQFSKRPNFPLSVLKDPNALQLFKNAVEWAIDQARASHDSKVVTVE